MARFALTPPLPKGPRAEPFAAQLALARVHPQLIPLLPSPSGYVPAFRSGGDWSELPTSRGLAGYGLSRALRILLDVLSGLRALHGTQTDRKQPFVHGEVGPAALRVDALGVTRLIPLAPWHWSAEGTPAREDRRGYLAPERLLGDAMDQRADVYSAGVLLWEALAGRRLFERESVEGIITRLMGGKVNMPELPPELSWALPLKSVAMRALSVDPGQRFGSCAEFAHAVDSIAGAQIATHGDIALYFHAPDQSVVTPLPSRANHNSSLSALVAPVQLVAPDPAVADTEPPPAHSSPSAARRLFFAAGLASVVAGVALTGLDRYEARRPASGAPSPASTIEPRAASRVRFSTLPAAPPVTMATPSALIEPPSVPTAPASAPRLGGDNANKHRRVLKTPKPSVPKLQTPSARPRTVAPLNEGEQYGI